jgi:hypothetical protein
MPNDPRSSGKKSQAALQILRSSVRLTMKDFDLPSVIRHLAVLAGSLVMAAEPSLRAQAPTSRRVVAVVPIAAS